jgi:site-specific recombinase XerC
MMIYRHGLRVSEAIGLRRDHVNLAHARLWVSRLKNSLSVEHPIAGIGGARYAEDDIGGIQVVRQLATSINCSLRLKP